MAKKILVIGGGISGLSAAYSLKKKGFEVRLLETRNRVGGVIGTVSESGFRAESGSNSVMVKSRKTLEFINEIGLGHSMIEASKTAKKRFFVKNGKICEVPMNPMKMIFSRLFSIGAKFRFLGDLRAPSFDPEADPSIDEFTVHRLGREAADYGMNPFMAGVYGGDTSKLSARYAFPAFWDLDQKYGSIIRGAMKSMKEKKAAGNFFKPLIISFKDGLVELTDRLAEILKEEIVVGAKIASIDYDMGGWRACWTCSDGEECDEFDAMVLAVPSNVLKDLPLPGTLSIRLWKLDQIDYAPIATVTYGFKRSQIAHPLDGFGVLVPEKENKYRILGSLFLSTMFENRAPADCVTLTCYLGGKRHPEFMELSDDCLDEIARDDMKALLGLSGEPLFKRMFRWDKAIAQYNVGYGEFLEAMDEAEAEFPTVRLIGSYRGGVSVSACIENGLSIGDSIADER